MLQDQYQLLLDLERRATTKQVTELGARRATTKQVTKLGGMVMSSGALVFVDNISGNNLLLDSTKPLQMLTNHQ